MTKHLKHMAIGAALVFGALVLFGVSWATALRYALVLACPVMMLGMMVFMNRGSGQSQPACHYDHSSDREATHQPGSSTRQM